MRNGANIFDLYRQVQLKESEILERTLTDAEKEKLKKLEKEVPMKDFKDRYGKEGESVYYATLTKMAKDEGFASDAQRRAAFAQGYKAKGKKGKKEETELDEAKYEVQYTISSRVGDSRSRMRSKLFKMDVDARNKEDAEKKFYKIVNKTPNLKSAADRDMLDVPYIGLKETLDEKFTKKDFDKNEDENRHTENAIELVKMFGTSAEDIKVNAIAARHNMKGSIDRKDQQNRDALIKKYYPKLKEEVELDEKYDLYHSTFSGAMQHAYDYAKSKLGVTVDPKEIDRKVATGPRKPTQGKTNTYRLKGKGGNLQIQVFNKGGSKPFELNMYKEEVELDENGFVVGKIKMPKMKGGAKLQSKTNFDFRLFDPEDSPGSDKANDEMNREIVKASKMKDKQTAMAHMSKIQRKHSKHGATDTEPREVISQVLNRVFGESVELGEAMKYNFMVLDPDGKVMGMTSSEKNANDMAKPTGNLLKLRGRVVKLRRPMATTRGDRMIGMLPADNLGEGTDPIKEMIESGNFTRTEIKNMIKRRILDEAKFQVNYSKGGKLFSKTINAKDEDDAEDKAIKKFKIDDDDIRSVVKEGLNEKFSITLPPVRGGKKLLNIEMGRAIRMLKDFGATKSDIRNVLSGKGGRFQNANGEMFLVQRESVELDEVIPKSTMYALVKDGKVIAKGSKRDMTSKKKKEGGTVYNAPSKKVGDTIKEGYESEVLDVLSNADIDGYFKNNKLYISRRDASDAKKALEDADNITKLPKMVMEALDKEDEPKVKQIVKKLKKASQAHAGQASDLEKAISEDGHTDVASAIRQCKTVLEDSMQMLQKLKSMSPEDSLPSWWTNKLAVASNNMNKMRDYLLVPSMSEKTDKNNK